MALLLVAVELFWIWSVSMIGVECSLRGGMLTLRLEMPNGAKGSSDVLNILSLMSLALK